MNPDKVRLYTGKEVLADSEEWRHECEARHILAMPGKEARRRHLRGDDTSTPRHKGVLQHRGMAEVERLEQTIIAIWEANRLARASETK